MQAQSTPPRASFLWHRFEYHSGTSPNLPLPAQNMQKMVDAFLDNNTVDIVSGLAPSEASRGQKLAKGIERFGKFFLVEHLYRKRNLPRNPLNPIKAAVMAIELGAQAMSLTEIQGGLPFLSLAEDILRTHDDYYDSMVQAKTYKLLGIIKVIMRSPLEHVLIDFQTAIDHFYRDQNISLVDGEIDPTTDSYKDKLERIIGLSLITMTRAQVRFDAMISRHMIDRIQLAKVLNDLNFTARLLSLNLKDLDTMFEFSSEAADLGKKPKNQMIYGDYLKLGKILLEVEANKKIIKNLIQNI
ncbi:hypothetical protein BVY03_01970 [bacterium K02(2017)]|nr:hypothetical protein BVY03_01970 [bacterium K02(2017)]